MAAVYDNNQMLMMMQQQQQQQGQQHYVQTKIEPGLAPPSSYGLSHPTPSPTSSSFSSSDIPSPPPGAVVSGASVLALNPRDAVRCHWSVPAPCNVLFPDPESLYNHLCNDHVGRKSTNNLCLECHWDDCTTISAKRDHLTSHLRIHIPLKPHVCPICSRAFKRPQDLKKHDKLHQRDAGGEEGVNIVASQRHALRETYKRRPSPATSVTSSNGNVYTAQHVPSYNGTTFPPSPNLSEAGTIISNHSPASPLTQFNQPPTIVSSNRPLAIPHSGITQPALQPVYVPSSSGKRDASSMLDDFVSDVKRKRVTAVYDDGMRRRLDEMATLLMAFDAPVPNITTTSAPQQQLYTAPLVNDLALPTPTSAYPTSAASLFPSLPPQQNNFFPNPYMMPPAIVSSSPADLSDINAFLDQLAGEIGRESAGAASLPGVMPSPMSAASSSQIPIMNLNYPGVYAAAPPAPAAAPQPAAPVVHALPSPGVMPAFAPTSRSMSGARMVDANAFRAPIMTMPAYQSAAGDGVDQLVEGVRGLAVAGARKEEGKEAERVRHRAVVLRLLEIVRARVGALEAEKEGEEEEEGSLDEEDEEDDEAQLP
ncbi:hypothetical protein HK101_010113 [Irineochytrium annulatum]|nr:hypothetical protein HK101_010113 [Irineochytrium annulatum]